MAGLFDWGMWMGPNLTPQESKALATAGSRALASGATGAVTAPLEGEFIPRGNPVQPAGRVAGLLGVDAIPGERPPVTTQSASAGARGAAGAAPGGSNIVPRNMQQVGPGMKEVFGERVPNARLAGPAASTVAEAAGAGGRGLLGKALGVLGGPVTGVIAGVADPGVLGNGELTPEQVVQLYPERGGPSDNEFTARRFSGGGSGRAGGGATGSWGDEPQAPSPEVAQAAAQERARQVESTRQVVEQGAKDQLAAGAVSRPQLAQAVVEADIQRSGEKVTPDEMKKRVAEESVAMKSMDNNELSKYVSYALIAGGLLASAFDKSGEAGRAFAGSFNAQLDRQSKERLLKAQQDAQAAIAARKDETTRRGQDITLLDVKSKVQDRTAGQEIARGGLQIKEALAGGQLSRWEAQSANDAARLAAYRDRTAAQAAKGNTSKLKVPELSTKDATELVSAYNEAKGLNVDKRAVPVIADRYRVLRQQNPDLTPDQLMEATMRTLNLNKEDTAWYQSGDMRVTIPK